MSIFGFDFLFKEGLLIDASCSVHAGTLLAGADMVIPRPFLAQGCMTLRPRTTKPAGTMHTPVVVVVLVISMVDTNVSDGWFCFPCNEENS